MNLITHNPIHKELWLTPIEQGDVLKVGVNLPTRVVEFGNIFNSVSITNISFRNIPLVIRNVQVEVCVSKINVIDWFYRIGPVDADRLLSPMYSHMLIIHLEVFWVSLTYRWTFVLENLFLRPITTINKTVSIHSTENCLLLYCNSYVY